MTKRKQRSKEELKQASDHLFYEIWMFKSLTQIMALGVIGEGVLNNALLEAFMIHLRVLIDFFFAERPKQDAVIAEDFFSPPEKWHEVRSSQSDLLKRAKNRVHKEAAHLTYARQKVTPEKKLWTFVEIDKEIAIIINEFFNAVDTNLLGDRWEAVVKQQPRPKVTRYGSVSLEGEADE
jgi:hypothetical protein